MEKTKRANRINTINVQYLKALNVSRAEYKLLKYVFRNSRKTKGVCKASPKTICLDIGWSVASGMHRQVIRRLTQPITLHGKQRPQLLIRNESGLSLCFKWKEDSYVTVSGSSATMVFPKLQRKLGLTDLQYGALKLLENFAIKNNTYIDYFLHTEKPFVQYGTGGIAAYLEIHPQNVKRLLKQLYVKGFIDFGNLLEPVDGFVNRVNISKKIIIIVKSVVEEEKNITIPEAEESREDRLDRQDQAYIERLTEEGKDWRQEFGIEEDYSDLILEDA